VLVLPDDPSLDEHARHYATVARAIAYLRAHAARQPGLEELAAAVHLSPPHLQRVFSRWAGISPKRFLQVLTKDSALQRLRQSRANGPAWRPAMSKPTWRMLAGSRAGAPGLSRPRKLARNAESGG
jgi:AraC-like DNA-binding protein